MKRFLVLWLIAAAAFMSLAAIWMNPWEQEREAVYSLRFPQVSPTLAEKQELAYRWFHREDTEILRDLDDARKLEKFTAMNLLSYDYRLYVGNSTFKVTYLGMTDDGRVYYVSIGDEWVSPYSVSSYELKDDRLHLRLKRSDEWVAFWLGAAAAIGIFLAVFINKALPQREDP